jgi:hypothetical protein
MNHVPECAWERTTLADCQYRATHHYCPHPEHACTCPPRPAAADEDRLQASQVAEALELLDAHTWPIDEIPCRFDHHGGCQEHGFLSLEPGEKCPTLRAHELLVRLGIRHNATKTGEPSA